MTRAAGVGGGVSCTFWESLSGQTYELGSGYSGGGGGHPYLTLACIFSHEAFYANTQPSCALDASFSRPLRPVGVEGHRSRAVRHHHPDAERPLTPSTLADPGAVLLPSSCSCSSSSTSIALRFILRLVSNGTRPSRIFSPRPELCMRPSATAARPSARRSSRRASGATPHGHIKGLPQHFTTCDADLIFRAWQASEVACDILRCRTYKAAFAVRVCGVPDGG